MRDQSHLGEPKPVKNASKGGKGKGGKGSYSSGQSSQATSPRSRGQSTTMIGRQIGTA
jgi:hypothetical protein